MDAERWQRLSPLLDALFELDPSLPTTLFAGVDTEAQARRLIAMIDTAVGLLGTPEQLVPALEALGARHAGYGVEARHYPTVAEALMDTLKAGLGTALTPAATEAWGRTYGVMRDVMLAGTESEEGQRRASEYAARWS